MLNKWYFALDKISCFDDYGQNTGEENTEQHIEFVDVKYFIHNF